VKPSNITGYVMVAIGALILLWLVLGHPQMTQTQLLLTYWREYLFAMVAIIAGAVVKLES
jgi:hypothetical protein